MPTIGVLGLGNDLLADDAFGVEVLRELRERLPPEIQTASSIASGFALLDELTGVDRMIVIDTIATGEARPGTVHRWQENDLVAVPGGGPHYVGLFDALRLGRELGLHVPGDVVIVAVEAGDCLTIGGAMTEAVRAAMPVVIESVGELIAGWRDVPTPG
jgi:hydrogenase maturation protease